jgi:hypothetical protein
MNIPSTHLSPFQALAEALRWRAARPRIDPGLSADFDRRLREARSVPEWPRPDWPADVFGRWGEVPGEAGSARRPTSLY